MARGNGNQRQNPGSIGDLLGASAITPTPGPQTRNAGAHGGSEAAGEISRIAAATKLDVQPADGDNHHGTTPSAAIAATMAAAKAAIDASGGIDPVIGSRMPANEMKMRIKPPH